MNLEVESTRGEHEDVTDVAVADVTPSALIQSDPTAALENTEKLVRYMSERCTGPKFISTIQGRSYPKVEWWTTVGMTLGLLPVEISSTRVDFDGGYKYEAVVEVRRGDQVITRASAICSTDERAWGRRDEYAVKSMASTRATGKAYRIGLSALAVMAGLEATPADEIPPQGFSDRYERRPEPKPVDPEWQEALDLLRAALDAAGYTEDADRQKIMRQLTDKKPNDLSAEELTAMREHIPPKD